MIHELRATPDTCFWGFFDAALPPVLRVRSGDLVRIEALTHQAGDAPDLMMDPGVDAVYRAIPIESRGPGVHVMTGPIHVEGAAPGDTLEVRVAARSLLSFLVDQKGLSRDDAYSLISVAGEFGVTQVVDQRQGVHGMIAKNLFVPTVSA